MKLEVDITHTQIVKKVIEFIGLHTRYPGGIYSADLDEDWKIEFGILIHDDSGKDIVLLFGNPDNPLDGACFTLTFKKSYFNRLLKEIEEETGIARKKLLRGLNGSILTIAKYRATLSLNIRFDTSKLSMIITPN